MATNEIRANVQVLDNTITEPKLNVSNSPSVPNALKWDGASLKWDNITFLELGDTPSTYTGYGYYAIIVSPGEAGIIYMKNDTVGYDSHLLRTDGDGKITVVGINVDTTGVGNGEIYASGDIRTGGGLSIGSLTQNPAAGELYATSKEDLGGTLRVNGSNDFVTGSGVEIAFVNPKGYISAYDRSSSAYRELNIRGNPVIFPIGDAYTVAWTDYGGTSTIVGITTITTKEIYYKKIGAHVWVTFRLVGTGSTTAFTFTLPYNSAAGATYDFQVRAKDNGVTLTSPSLGELGPSSNTVTLYKDMTGAAWTAALGRFAMGQFDYEASS